MKKAALFVICASCCLYLINTAAAATLYVGSGQQYSTIQSAINAASSGDTISVAAGTYNESVNVNKRLTIVGSGSVNSIVAPSPTISSVFNIGSGGAFSSIEGFTITSASPVISPVNVQGSNVNVSNNKIGGGSFGVNLLAGSSSITNNEIYNSLYHGVLISANDNDVADNIIRNALTGNGVQVQSGNTGNVIRGNAISSNRNYGMYIYGTQNTVSGNAITNNLGGIFVGPGANANYLLANTINYNAERAVLIASSNNVVDSNSVSYNNGHSIFVDAPGTGNLINANNVQYSGENGIQLNWGSSGNVVTNNRVEHAGRLAMASGIYLANSSRNIVTHNNVAHSSEHGIEMDFGSPHNLIANNVVSHTAAQGILGWESYEGGNEIRSNEVYGNGHTYPDGGAIQVHGHENLIVNNRVYDNNNNAGIAVYPAGQWGIPGGYTPNGLTTHHNTVIGNEVSGLGGNNGIALHTATHTVVTHNTALSGLNRGIYIETASANENLIYFNTFKGRANQIANVGSSNTWNSIAPQNYTYNGVNYTGYIGNYWSDYSGNDLDGNGIGIPTYRVGSVIQRDNYPLMQGTAAYSGVHPIPGDYNIDGMVDVADYIVWRNGLGTMFNQSDYYVWRASFGRTLSTLGGSASTSGSSKLAAAVPEPDSTLLIATGALVLGTMLALKPRTL